MKKYIFVAMAALFVSCSDQQLTDSVTDVKSTELVQTSDVNDKAKVNALIERARWGDGQAFLQLADCYRDGIGVKKDFLGMACMVIQANAYGAIKSEKEYFSRIPDDNVYKQCFALADMSGNKLRTGKDSILTILNAMDCPDALAIQGIVSVECGDTIGGFETIRKAAGNGSNFASVLLTMNKNDGDLHPDRDKLERIVDRTPVVYKMLGRIYRDSEEDNDTNKRLAARYYLEADKHALLSKHEAMWLLSYYRSGGDIQLSDEDIRRLEAFSHVTGDEHEIIVADTVGVDSIDNQ